MRFGRVYVVLRKWIEKRVSDLCRDTELLASVREFVDEVALLDGMQRLSECLRTHVEKVWKVYDALK